MGAPPKNRMLERLVAEKLVTPEQQEAVLNVVARTGDRIEEVLLELKAIDEITLLKHLATVHKTRFVSTEKLAKAEIDQTTLAKVPRKLAERATVFPVLYDAATSTLSVVMPDPGDIQTINDVQIAVGRERGARLRGPSPRHQGGDRQAYLGDIHAFASLDRDAARAVHDDARRVRAQPGERREPHDVARARGDDRRARAHGQRARAGGQARAGARPRPDRRILPRDLERPRLLARGLACGAARPFRGRSAAHAPHLRAHRRVGVPARRACRGRLRPRPRQDGRLPPDGAQRRRVRGAPQLRHETGDGTPAAARSRAAPGRGRRGGQAHVRALRRPGFSREALGQGDPARRAAALDRGHVRRSHAELAQSVQEDAPARASLRSVDAAPRHDLRPEPGRHLQAHRHG